MIFGGKDSRKAPFCSLYSVEVTFSDTNVCFFLTHMDKMLKHPPFLGTAQDFVVRNDMQCGSTIGPKLASGLGIRTVDVGAPQLSMHSIREMCGIDDVLHSYNHFKAFFEEFSLLDAKLSVDDEA